MVRNGWLAEALDDGIAAVSEATFPENAIGAPDWRSTEMVRRTHAYLDELPAKPRRLVVALFVFVELAAPLLTLSLRRFSRLDAGRRAEVIRRWRRSGFFPLRLLGEALKATTTMMYMSHPSVAVYIGEYRACSRPLDAVQIPTRLEAAAGMRRDADAEADA